MVQTKLMIMKNGMKKTVMDSEGNTHTGCFGCPHCHDTGFSYICSKTGEKLEGWTTLEDKLSDNKNELLKRNILVGVGNKCPLTTIIKSRMTQVKFTVSLEEIEEFIEENSYNVSAEVDEDDEGNEFLNVWVTWFDDGYESDRDYRISDLFDIVDEIEAKFEVNVKDGDCGNFDDMESVIITLP